MSRSALVVLVSALLAVAVARADIITIDGSDADWGSPDWWAYDAADLGGGYEGYDVTWVAHEADTDQNRICFAYYVVGTLPAPAPGVYTRMFLDVDMNPATGGSGNGWSGIDYYIQWDYDNTSAATAYRWNVGTSTFDLDTPFYVDAKKGDGSSGYPDNFVEFALSVGDTIGNENGINHFRVVSAFEGPGGVVDVAPDLDKAPGEEYSPEPTTLALLPLGLSALALWRRRQKQAVA